MAELITKPINKIQSVEFWEKLIHTLWLSKVYSVYEFKEGFKNTLLTQLKALKVKCNMKELGKNQF